MARGLQALRGNARGDAVVKTVAIIGLLSVAACAHTPVYSAAQVEAIMQPLAYEQQIVRKCDEAATIADADNFLASLRGDAAEQAAEILSFITLEVAEGEAEYVCTVELYYSTQERADDARALWATLKGNS
ncbi:MAG: hypothetical protein IPK75_14620 [Acidobacteria bacterium]|nr:hypothetical protein [Acidobacteriota bacterium]